MKNISNNAIVVGVIGLIVGLVLGWMIGRGNADTNSSEMTKQMETEQEVSDDFVSMDSEELSSVAENTPNVLSANGAMSEESRSAVGVGDQGAGQVVTVDSVETDASAWVVVREQVNGIAGSILGATRVNAGTNKNVVLNLLRATVPDQVYEINLFKDNGDKIFDHKVDVMMTSGGNLISQSFKTFAQ